MAFGKRHEYIGGFFSFIVSVFFMVGGYTFASYIYEVFFIVHTHRNVGMVFIPFFFFLIASPSLFISAFVSEKYNVPMFILVLIYLLSEWFYIHPLRVTLMAVTYTTGYVILLLLKKWVVA